MIDTSTLYSLFAKTSHERIDDGICSVRWLSFTSRNALFLVKEDQGIEENLRFSFPLFTRNDDDRREDLLIILHGLNEGVYTKLFPWAYAFAHRGLATMIFPMTFHINRRPPAWINARMERYRDRCLIGGNRKMSPYNAVISDRLDQRPDRFFRGTLQTARDITDFVRGIRDGEWEPLFPREMRLHFLGYSAGGYLSLLILLINSGGLLDDSRCAIFSSGATMDAVAPDTLLILDGAASDRLIRFYGDREYTHNADGIFQSWMEETQEGIWFREIFFHGTDLSSALTSLKEYVGVILNTHDEVFPVESVRWNLHGLRVDGIRLGIHEFPFNIDGPLDEVYTERGGRKLIVDIGRSYAPNERYQRSFEEFIRRSYQIIKGGVTWR